MTGETNKTDYSIHPTTTTTPTTKLQSPQKGTGTNCIVNLSQISNEFSNYTSDSNRTNKQTQKRRKKDEEKSIVVPRSLTQSLSRSVSRWLRRRMTNDVSAIETLSLIGPHCLPAISLIDFFHKTSLFSFALHCKRPTHT